MAEPVTLGLDIGTSGVQVIAVDTLGRVLAEVNRNYPLHSPRPGWTEFWPPIAAPYSRYSSGVAPLM